MTSKTCGIESIRLRSLIAALLTITLAQIAGTGVAAAAPAQGVRSFWPTARCSGSIPRLQGRRCNSRICLG
jgi:hypothetical protein